MSDPDQHDSPKAPKRPRLAVHLTFRSKKDGLWYGRLTGANGEKLYASEGHERIGKVNKITRFFDPNLVICKIDRVPQ